MATASAARPRSRAAPGAPRRVLVAGAVIAGAALVLWLVYRPWHLNYDARYALLWARDFWTGHAPEYTADFAPTPRPLQTAASSLALPFGDGADDVLTWMTLLCFGALCWVVYRLGARLFSPWAGAVAALVVFTRPALERDALLAYQDIPFALLVVGAVLLEAQRPRRGVPVLALLAVAGLVRPEAWVLSGLYVLYLRRPGLLALAAVAPATWALTDWLVTGDALHSLHGTADLAVSNERRRDLADVPVWTPQYFGFALREPLVIGVPIGLVFAWRHARRPAALPLAVVAAMTLVFAVGPIFGLPLIRRYIGTPAVLLALFYGLAVCGWALLPRGQRRGWAIAAAFAAALSLAFIPWHAGMLSQIERRFDRDDRLYGDLQAVGEAPRVRATFAACAPLRTGDHRPVPFIRFWLDGDPGTVNTRRGRMLLMPRRSPTTRHVYHGEEFPRVAPPAGWATIYENRSWRVYAAPGCVTRPPS